MSDHTTRTDLTLLSDGFPPLLLGLRLLLIFLLHSVYKSYQKKLNRKLLEVLFPVAKLLAAQEYPEQPASTIYQYSEQF